MVTTTDDDIPLPRIRGTVRKAFISVINITDQINIFSPRESRPQMKSWQSPSTDVAMLPQITVQISVAQ